MDHLLHQAPHLSAPGTIRFILDTVFQISEDMCIAFLMITAVLIKRHLMIMNKDALIVFNRSAGNALVAFVFTGIVLDCPIRRDTDEYICRLSVDAGIRTIRMQDRL